MLTLTASGSVSDYSDTSSLQQAVAAAAGVDESLVTIGVVAASVLITATIAVPASTSAAAVQASLSSALGTATAASAALGVTVESAPTVVVVIAESEGSIEPQSSEGGVSTAAIIGATVGALTLGTLLGSWLVCHLCVRRREIKGRLSSKLSGVPTQRERSMGVEDEVVLAGIEIGENRVGDTEKRDCV